MRRGIAALAPLLLALSLAGCRLGFGTPSAGEPTTRAQPVKISMWNLLTNDRRQDAIQESIDRFNRTHRDIRIVPYYYENEAYKQKMRAAILSNHMPDIFYYWFGESFKRTMVDSGVAADLTPMIGRHPDFRGRILPDALDAVTYNGRVYGIPHSIQHVLIWYSKPVFARFGLKPPQTWDELTSAVDKLRAGGIAPVAAAGKERWQLLHWYAYLAHRLGGAEPFMQAVDGTGGFRHPSFVEAAERFRDFAARGAFMPGYLGMDQPQAENAFLSGQAAMFLQGDWAAARMLEDGRMKDRIGYFRFPTVDGKGKATEYQGGYSVGWAVSKTADPEAAFAVLDFLMSPEERARYVAVSGTPTTVVSADVSAQRLAPAVRDYIDFIGKDATGYFGFYDQDIDYRRAQLLLDMSVALAQDPDMTRGEIEAMLGDIK